MVELASRTQAGAAIGDTHQGQVLVAVTPRYVWAKKPDVISQEQQDTAIAAAKARLDGLDATAYVNFTKDDTAKTITLHTPDSPAGDEVIDFTAIMSSETAAQTAFDNAATSLPGDPSDVQAAIAALDVVLDAEITKAEADPVALAAIAVEKARAEAEEAKKINAPTVQVTDGFLKRNADGSYSDALIEINTANLIAGPGTPANTLGNDGFYYEQLDAALGTNDIWGPKAAGAWPAQADFKSADPDTSVPADFSSGAARENTPLSHTPKTLEDRYGGDWFAPADGTILGYNTRNRLSDGQDVIFPAPLDNKYITVFNDNLTQGVSIYSIITFAVRSPAGVAIGEYRLPPGQRLDFISDGVTWHVHARPGETLTLDQNADLYIEKRYTVAQGIAGIVGRLPELTGGFIELEFQPGSTDPITLEQWDINAVPQQLETENDTVSNRVTINPADLGVNGFVRITGVPGLNRWVIRLFKGTAATSNILRHIAIPIESSGTNAGSQLGITFVDVDGNVYPASDWRRNGELTQYAGGSDVIEFEDAVHSTIVSLGRNKRGTINFSYVGPNPNGLSEVRVSNAVAAGVNGSIVVSYDGTNESDVFVNGGNPLYWTTFTSDTTPALNPDDISDWDAAETDIDQGALRKFFNGGETLIFGRLVDDATADGGAGPDAVKWQDVTALDPNVLNYIDSDAAGGTAFGLFGSPARYVVTGATPVSIAFPSDGGLNENLWAMVFNKGTSTVTIEGKVINAGEGAIITADGGVAGPLVTLMGGSTVLPDGATETIHTFSTNNNVFSATFGGWQFKGNSTSRQIRVRNVSGEDRMAVNADAWRESAPKGNALSGSGVTSRVFGHNVENTLSSRDFTFDNGGGSSDGDVEYAAVTVYAFDSTDRLKFGKVQEMEVSMAVGHSWNGNDWRVVIREY